MKKVIKICNLDCAACAAELQEELEALDGINEVSVDFVGQRVTFEHEGEESLSKAIKHISSFEEVKIVDGNAPQKKDRHLKELLSIAISAIFFIPALVLHLMGIQPWVAFGLFLASFAAAGWTVIWSVIRNIGRAFKDGFHPGVLLDENLLMLIAAVGAFAIRQDMEGAIVMLAPAGPEPVWQQVMQEVSAILVDRPALLDALRAGDRTDAVRLLETDLSRRFCYELSRPVPPG